MGHSFGMQHDGTEGCPASGYVMGASVSQARSLTRKSIWCSFSRHIHCVNGLSRAPPSPRAPPDECSTSWPLKVAAFPPVSGCLTHSHAGHYLPFVVERLNTQPRRPLSKLQAPSRRRHPILCGARRTFVSLLLLVLACPRASKLDRSLQSADGVWSSLTSQAVIA